MPGLVPGIHVLCAVWKGVDGRDKPGHDAVETAGAHSHISYAIVLPKQGEGEPAALRPSQARFEPIACQLRQR
ncbi:hypothetical protein ACVWYQ_005542 [Bradyrhizobium sp. USDA 3397]